MVPTDSIDATDPSNGNGSFEFGQLLTDDPVGIEARPPSKTYSARIAHLGALTATS